MLKQKKQEGTDKFKAKDWTGAYDLYTEALAIDPCNKSVNAKLYLNRAISLSKVNNFKKLNLVPLNHTPCMSFIAEKVEGVCS